MFSLKRFLILIIAAVIITAAAGAQGRERTVEETYLMEPIEIMIIRETASSDSRTRKMISLDYIREALDRGSTNDDIRSTLEYLATESTRTITRENGKVINNYPEIRRMAVRYLGQIGTEEARKSLILVIQAETEPIVLHEAFLALGTIGTNENNETVTYMAIVMGRFINVNVRTNDLNLMALAYVETIEKIAQKNNGVNSQEAVRVLLNINNETNFSLPIRTQAMQLISTLRSYGAN